WNDLRLDSDVLSSGLPLFEKGDRLSLSPEFIAGASADYAFPFGASGLRGRLSASANYTSAQEQRTILIGVQVGRGDPMLIARMSASLDLPDNWTATLFVDNV